MTTELAVSEDALKKLLASVESGFFKTECSKIGIDEIIALDGLLTKYPKKADLIIGKLIMETDPAFIDSIHLGNYSQKAEILKTIVSRQTVSDGRSNFVLPKHVLIFGDAGVGKTSFINSLSERYDMIYINASNDRTFEGSARKINGASSTESLSGLPKLLFFDEIDSMARTGTDYLLSLIAPPLEEISSTLNLLQSQGLTKTEKKKIDKMRISLKRRSLFPIVMVCNDIGKVSDRIKKNDRVTILKFVKPSQKEIEFLLKAYAESYWNMVNQTHSVKLQKNELQIRKIAGDCDGDVRLAKTMLLAGEPCEKDENFKPIDIAYLVFTLDDRNKVYEILLGMKYSASTILSYINVNATRYYGKLSEIVKVSRLVSDLESLKFKTREEFFFSSIAFGINPSKFKEVTPIYPQKMPKVSTNGKESKN